MFQWMDALGKRIPLLSVKPTGGLLDYPSLLKMKWKTRKRDRDTDRKKQNSQLFFALLRDIVRVSVEN